MVTSVGASTSAMLARAAASGRRMAWSKRRWDTAGRREEELRREEGGKGGARGAAPLPFSALDPLSARRSRRRAPCLSRRFTGPLQLSTDSLGPAVAVGATGSARRRHGVLHEQAERYDHGRGHQPRASCWDADVAGPAKEVVTRSLVNNSRDDAPAGIHAASERKRRRQRKRPAPPVEQPPAGIAQFLPFSARLQPPPGGRAMAGLGGGVAARAVGPRGGVGG
jgi:hypothetical protein